MFNAGSWKIDRKSGVKFIPNTGASIVGGIQPKVLTKIFDLDSINDGLYPRFLSLLAENKPIKFSRKGINNEDMKEWDDLLDFCYKLPLSIDDNGFVDSAVLQFDSAALDIFEAFYNQYHEITPFLSGNIKAFIPKLITYNLKIAGVLYILKLKENESSIQKLRLLRINKEIIKDAITLTKYYAGQVIKTLKLYGNVEEQLNEYQLRLIETLQGLQCNVKSGELLLKQIVEEFNKKIPESLKLTPEKVRALLKELGLNTRKSTGNLSCLIWEEEKLQNLFSKTTVTTVTTVMPETQLNAKIVTEVTEGTVVLEKKELITGQQNNQTQFLMEGTI